MGVSHLKEQVFNAIRNLAENKQGVDTVFREMEAAIL